MWLLAPLSRPLGEGGVGGESGREARNMEKVVSPHTPKRRTSAQEQNAMTHCQSSYMDPFLLGEGTLCLTKID